jgi:hypothetical protein
MAIITLPQSLVPSGCTLAQVTNQRVTASPFGGSEQAVDMLNDRWFMTLEIPGRYYGGAAAVEAFINAMRGQTNTVMLYHFGRQRVRGTIAGALTLSATAAQGASSVSITATNGTTLLAGDLIGIGGLLLMVAADTTASGGVMAVSLTNRLRKQLTSGSAVTITRPTAEFRLASAPVVRYVPGFTDGFTVDFAEVIT